jgi:hypothetical protein
MLRIAIAALSFCFVHFPLASTGQDFQFPMAVPLAGATYELQTSISQKDDPSIGGKVISGTINIQPIIKDIDGIIRRLGLTTLPGNFQSMNYHGTGGEMRGSELWFKYHFEVDPHKAKPTNGSVEIWMHPEITNGGIAFKVHNTKLNISNDIARAYVKFSDIDKAVEAQAANAVNQSLANNIIKLPDWLSVVGLVVSDVKFHAENGEGYLSVTAVQSGRVRVYNGSP